MMLAVLLAQALTVTFAEGEVTAAGARVQAGAVLHEGDTVQTGPGGRVELTLPQGTVMRLGESSRMTLRSAQPGRAFSAKLWLGDVWARVHKLLVAETFEVETENAVAGVRGTEFRVQAGQEDLLRVYEGAVEVKGAAWAHRVEPGRELRFSRERAPAGPAAFDSASDHGKFMEWVRSRPERDVRPKEKIKEKDKDDKDRKRDRRKELRNLQR